MTTLRPPAKSRKWALQDVPATVPSQGCGLGPLNAQPWTMNPSPPAQSQQWALQDAPAPVPPLGAERGPSQQRQPR